jgi:AraC-like DNA-binding protein
MKNNNSLNSSIQLSLSPENITVSQLANAAGLSPARFSHLFVLRTGMLPGAHLRLMKRHRDEQEMAIQLLANVARAQLPDS